MPCQLIWVLELVPAIITHAPPKRPKGNMPAVVGSTPPSGYALYGGAELVGNTAQAMAAATASALSSSFIYATSAAATLAVKLNTANPPDNAHLVPGSHIVAIRCGDGPS